MHRAFIRTQYLPDFRIIFRIFLLMFGVGSTLPGHTQSVVTTPFEAPYSPAQRPRVAAEWEPAIGVLIGWPLALPYKLVIQLARDTRLYVLIENRAAMQSAIQSFTRWGIMPNQVKFIQARRGPDYFWTRDWGPYGLFSADGTYRLGDPDYTLSTPLAGQACTDSLKFLFTDDAGRIIPLIDDDKATEDMAVALGQEVTRLSFAFTGGNVLADGQRTAFSTCALLKENAVKGIAEAQLRLNIRQKLGIDAYQVISNFESEGIQHIDCFMKLLDEERLLVLRLPADHPDAAQYEGIVEHELLQLKNAWGRPYQILRIDTDRYNGDRCAAYTNALILNTTIYVPLFGIPQDKVALEQWRDAMPGYTILGFSYVMGQEPNMDAQVASYYDQIGWKNTDALHCRTRAVWDPTMTYISVNRMPEQIAKARKYSVEAILKAYAPVGLAGASMQLKWRQKGGNAWKSIPMSPLNGADHFGADIPGGMAGVTIEYYVEVIDAEGRSATMPRTAPATPYQFTID